MHNTFSRRLAPLASIAIQRRYIVHGTRDECLLPTDLLHDIDAVIRQVRTMSAARESLPVSALEILLSVDELLAAADAAVQRGGSNEYLIEHDLAWRAVREQTARFLEQVGFDLPAWEKSEGAVEPPNTSLELTRTNPSHLP